MQSWTRQRCHKSLAPLTVTTSKQSPKPMPGKFAVSLLSLVPEEPPSSPRAETMVSAAPATVSPMTAKTRLLSSLPSQTAAPTSQALEPLKMSILKLQLLIPGTTSPAVVASATISSGRHIRTTIMSSQTISQA